MECFYKVRTARMGVEAGLSRMPEFWEVITSERSGGNRPARLGHSDLPGPAEGGCNDLDREPSGIAPKFGEIKLTVACNRVGVGDTMKAVAYLQHEDVSLDLTESWRSCPSGHPPGSASEVSLTSPFPAPGSNLSPYRKPSSHKT